MQREDFASRAEPDDLPEWMDNPCSYETLKACLQDLQAVNRLTMSYGPTLRFLKAAAKKQAQKPLRVLDVGCGYGDMLRRIEQWGKDAGLELHLIGIDLNAKAVAAAREASSLNQITWITGNANDFAGDIDIVISSLVTHHMATPQIIEFLRWMESKAQVGWFINDLERQYTPAVWFGRLARLMRWHPFVQHDGPVSFRRAFREKDWVEMLRAVGLPDAAMVKKEFPARLCVERLK